jgi:hypothetical protein
MRNDQPGLTFRTPGSLEERLGGAFSGGNAQSEREYQLRIREEDRRDKDQSHRISMERFTGIVLCGFALAGILVYQSSPDKTLGTALIVGPMGAFIDRHATAEALKKKKKNDLED